MKRTGSWESLEREAQDCRFHLTFHAAQKQYLPVLALENNEGKFLMVGGEEDQHRDRTTDTAG